MMMIGDSTVFLYAIISILGSLLAGYGVALLVAHGVSHPKPAPKSAQPVTAEEPDAKPGASWEHDRGSTTLASGNIEAMHW